MYRTQSERKIGSSNPECDDRRGHHAGDPDPANCTVELRSLAQGQQDQGRDQCHHNRGHMNLDRGGGLKQRGQGQDRFSVEDRKFCRGRLKSGVRWVKIDALAMINSPIAGSGSSDLGF